MARTYKVGVILTGDSSGAVKATVLEREQLEKLNASTARASRITDNYSKSIGALGGRIATFTKWATAGVAAAAGIGAAFSLHLIKRGIESADALSKLSEKLNIGTEALAAMQLEAELTGVSGDKLGTALGRMTVNIGKAATGMGPAAAAAKTLGLNIGEILRLPADQQFGVIADSLNKVSTFGQKAALASAFFGKGVADLIPIISAGSAGVAEAAEQAKVLGLALTDLSARRVAEAKDAIELLQHGVKGFGEQLGVALAPAIQLASERLYDFVKQSGGMETVAAKFSTVVVDMTADVADAWSTVGDVYELATIRAETAILKLQRTLLDFKAGTRDVMENIINLPMMMAGGDPHSALLPFSPRAGDEARAQSNEIGKALGELRERYDEILKSAGASGNAVRKFFADAKANAATSMPKVIAQVEQLSEASEDLEMAWRGLDEAALSRNMVKASEALDGVIDAMLESEHTISVFVRANDQAALDVIKAWEHAGERIDDAFAKAWQNALTGAGGFKEFADDLKDGFKQLVGELAHFLITRPLLVQLGVTGAGVGDQLAAAAAGGGSGKWGGPMAGGDAGGLIGSLTNVFGGGGGAGGGSGVGGLSGFAGTAATSLASYARTAVSWVGNKLIGLGLTNVGTSLSSVGSVGQLGPLNYSGATGAGVPSPVLSAGNVVGGLVGGYAGNKLGEAAFNKQANPYVGATAQAAGAYGGAAIGATYGSWGGPIGAAIGAAIGALISVAAGSDKKGQRVKLGITGGGAASTGENDSVVGASGLRIGSVGKRLDKESGAALDQLFATFQQIDAALTGAATAAGVKVDFRNVALTNPNPAGREAGASFFGSFRKGEIKPEDVQRAADDFVKAWITQIDTQLPARVRAGLKGVEQTADSIVTAFSALTSIDKLLNLDVVKETTDALVELGKANKTSLEAYSATTAELYTVTTAYDGSTDAIVKLNEALSSQKVAAVELAVAYKAVGAQIDQTFGTAIDRIQESVMTDEEIYAKRQKQIADLNDSLATELDPDKISAIVQQLDQLQSDAFGRLDPESQKALAPGFVSTIQQEHDLAKSRIDAGLGQLSTSESGVNATVDAQLAIQAAQQKAADTQNTAANTNAATAASLANSIAQFGAYVAQMPLGGSGAAVYDIGAGGSEVNSVSRKSRRRNRFL